jgi:hypothetical protein
MRRFVAALAALVVAFGLVGNFDVADEYERGALEKEVRPARVLSMPPATGFEEPHRLRMLAIPLLCNGSGGEEWIRQWGDGDLPPAIPTCVNAWIRL